MALSPGSIAFTGFNADGNDSIAFVALVDIALGETIVFEDNEWTGSAWTDTNEGAFSWTATTLVPAGTIVRLDNVGVTTPSPAASTGTIAFVAGRGTNRGINATDEVLYAYQGSATAPTFLAAVTNGSFLASTTGLLTGTGLSAGVNALDLGALDAGADIAAYVGPRAGQTSFAAYLSLLNNPLSGNWISQDAGGDQGNDGTTPDVPFSSTAFTVGAGAPSVDLSVSSSAGSESGQTVVTVTATASSAVSGDETVSIAVSGVGITAGDYILSGTSITIPTGQINGSVIFTIVDDADIEGSETVTLTISNPSAGITLGATVSQNIVIADNDGVPTVNLSLSTNAGSEAAATSITVTATASAAVTGNQTVTLGVAGTGITAADYYLSRTLITIPAGQTSGSVTLVIADDAVVEAAETATLTISAPSAGIALGATTSQNVAITDNAGSFLTKIAGATSANGAEIPAFDPVTDKLFVVAGTALEVYTMSASGALAASTPLQPGFTPVPGSVAVPNSVAVKNGVVAVAWATVNTATNAQGVGHVTLYDSTTGTVLNDLAVGFLPDMLTFSPDGNRIVVANEGEPNSYGQSDSFDPAGSISIIDLSGGAASATVQEAGFGAFDSQIASLKAQGVRIFGPNATVSQDLEPEYVTITPDGLTAIVTLQENNAAAVVDLATAAVTAIVPLGTKDFSLPGNGFDASDRDVNGTSGGGGKVNILNWPVKGMYMPDAIANFTVDGQTYYITANEGDSRDYTGYSEEVRVNSASYVLDPTLFPNAATLKLDANLGRLQLTNASGDTDGDTDFDQIMAFGGRSFTIWDPVGTPIYDSGDKLEQITAARSPTLFNSDGTAASFDTRSDNKGPEPEGVVVGVIGSRTYAFIGSERTGDVLVFDVSVPSAPSFVQYINMPEDLSPEGLSFVPAADSPTGKPLLITANEVSKTVAVFQVQVPVRIADIQGAAHISPLNGQGVKDVVGKVTAIASNGFWIQDPTPDANPATSDGIFVFTTNASILGARSLGEAVKVSGTVTEFRAAGDPDNLTLTEITHNAAVQALVVSAWTDAPAGAIAPIVLGVDRTTPTSVISAPGNAETQPVFDPAAEGIDFWESLEGMLVQANNPLATSPTNRFGEIWVLPNDGAGATSVTARGGSLITASDFNPERLQLDNLLASQVFPNVDVGARLDTVTGVIDYSFKNFELRTLATPTVAQASTLQREVTNLINSANQLTVATFNVENLDPGDGAAKFGSLAAAIVDNLKSPDILNLEEVQDNNGATNNGVVDASGTIQTLIDAIAAAGGPTYQYRQLDPVNNQDGGEPGGNIRVVFLFNPQRVSFVDGTLQRLIDPDLADGDAFASSRKPLVGDFVFNGETITVIGNHFNSKGGDDPLFGPTQPPVLFSEVQRNQQADVVGDFIDARLASKPGAYVVVAGDLNDFEFSSPLTRLEASGMTSLIETLQADERYSYNFEGNAQTLDHLMSSSGLLRHLNGYDVVHINSEFAVQVSDHDPVVARFDIVAGQILVGTRASNALVGGAGNDSLTGLQGRDKLSGGAGADKFVYTSLLDAGDIVTDFEVGVDKLVIGQLLASVGYTGTDPIGAGYLGVTAGAGRSFVTFDPDGSAGGGVARQLVELIGVAQVLPAELIDIGA